MGLTEATEDSKITLVVKCVWNGGYAWDVSTYTCNK